MIDTICTGLPTDVLGQRGTHSEYERMFDFLEGTIDSIPAHIAILDGQGTILFVNEQWKRFAVQNGFQGDDFGIGSNYLTIADEDKGDGATIASDVATGIRSVIQGACTRFEYEYPCDSPTEKRWFLLTVSRFDSTGTTKLVVSHQNITELKVS
ncbi:MAG: PAS domain-containing protein [Planctomycetota bacterium]|nr:PAS domain-containing protein [Planctomycetota bacterium]